VDISAPQFTKDGLAKLSALKELTELTVSNEKLEDADLATLGKLTSLKKLTVFAPKVTDKGIAELKGLKALQMLDVRGTEITTRSVPALRGLGQLKVLLVPVLPADAKSKAKLAEWRRLLPRVTIKPAMEMSQGLPLGGGIFRGGRGGRGGIGGAPGR
jgi:hypothetical protein